MQKFRVEGKTKSRYSQNPDRLVVNFSAEMDRPMNLKVREFAEAANLTPAELVRQMILHCLFDLDGDE